MNRCLRTLIAVCTLAAAAVAGGQVADGAAPTPADAVRAATPSVTPGVADGGVAFRR